jgi:hypothetical protein
VLEFKLITLLVKIPVDEPSIVFVLNAIVGFVEVLHTTPLAIIGLLPVFRTLPPEITEEAVIADTAIVVIVGKFDNDLKTTSCPYDVPELLDA